MSIIKNSRNMEIVKFENKQEYFVHSNKLIEARYILTPQEQRLILAMVSMIKPSDENFKEYKIEIKDFANFFNIKGNSVFANIRNAAKSLVEKSITIKDKDRVLYASWISSAEFPDGESYVSLCFDPKLKPYLLQLKEQYTLLESKYLVQLKSFYAIRIYMILRQHISTGMREIEVDELKTILCIKDEYKNYFDFKSNVVVRACTEINNKTDLFVSFSEKKQGRKVCSIVFSITEKQDYVQIIANDQKINDNKMIIVEQQREERAKKPTKEEIKQYFDNKEFKSNYEAFYDYYDDREWQGVRKWEVKANSWERKYHELKPASSTAVINSAAIKLDPMKEKIKKVLMGKVNESVYFIYFEDAEVKENIIYVNNKDALRYQEYLNKVGLEIEVK